MTYTIRLKNDSINDIHLTTSRCTNQTQCTEEIIVPQQPVYDQYFIEITASNKDLGTNSSSQTTAIGQLLIIFQR